MGLESWNPCRIIWEMSQAKYAKFITVARIFIMAYYIVWDLFELIVLKIGGLETNDRLLIKWILTFVLECILFKSISQKNRKCVNVWRGMYLLKNLRYFYPISTMPISPPEVAVVMHWILRSFSKELEQEEKDGHLKPEPMPYKIGFMYIVAYLDNCVHFSAPIDY